MCCSHWISTYWYYFRSDDLRGRWVVMTQFCFVGNQDIIVSAHDRATPTAAQLETPSTFSAGINHNYLVSSVALSALVFVVLLVLLLPPLLLPIAFPFPFAHLFCVLFWAHSSEDVY